jgi:hypothetical protein
VTHGPESDPRQRAATGYGPVIAGERLEARDPGSKEQRQEAPQQLGFLSFVEYRFRYGSATRATAPI